MKDLVFRCGFWFLLTILPYFCISQEISDSTLYHIETIDKNDFVGYILEKDSIIVLKSDHYGVINIKRSNIKAISVVDVNQMKDGSYWKVNPQSSRYFWSPNGYGLKKGEGYYQNVWVLFNQVSAGITDNISVGGGFIPLFLFSGAPTPVWITPKFSIPVVKEKINVGGGALLGTVIGEDETGFGILYGTFTLGSKDYNVSSGIGYGYAGKDWTKTPVLNLSSMIRLGPRGYFLTENYYITTGDSKLLILSFGGRHIIKKASIDYGLVLPL